MPTDEPSARSPVFNRRELRLTNLLGTLCMAMFFVLRAGTRPGLNIDTYDALALIFSAASTLAITETDRIVRSRRPTGRP